MNRLLALQKIIETGSFTKAAQELGYTQSSISQAVASLEAEFDIKLLNRSRTGVSLTNDGKKIYPRFLELIRQYDETQVIANQINGLETGTVKIGAINSISRYWLPGLIKGFEASHPNIHFTLYQGNFDEVRDYILSGKVDIGFLKPPYTKDLKTHPLKDEKMLAIVPANHPLHQQKTASLEKLFATSDNIILIPEGSHSSVLDAFHQVNLYPQVKDKIQDDYTVMSMVEAGLGISFISELMQKDCPFDIHFLKTTPIIRHSINLAYKNEGSLSTASKRFIRYIESQRNKLI